MHSSIITPTNICFIHGVLTRSVIWSLKAEQKSLTAFLQMFDSMLCLEESEGQNTAHLV